VANKHYDLPEFKKEDSLHCKNHLTIEENQNELTIILVKVSILSFSNLNATPNMENNTSAIPI
jgi:hypothetical protein